MHISQPREAPACARMLDRRGIGCDRRGIDARCMPDRRLPGDDSGRKAGPERAGNGPMAPVVDFAIAFERSLPCGLCVGVHIPEEGSAITPAVMARLHPEEARHAATLHPRRQPTWIAGRLALRAALAGLGAPPDPILPDDRGAPRVPHGMVGSISHKRLLAVGLAGRECGWTVGVDVEQRQMGKQDITRHVLREAERAELAALDPEARDRAVMLRFSLKESIYKAIDPHVRRFVGFQEVGLVLLPDGRAHVETHLERAERLEIQGWWSIAQDHVLTTARARPVW
jgi:enterobactin synthetase component D